MRAGLSLVQIRILAALSVLAISIGLAVLVWKLKPETVTRPPQEPVIAADLLRAESMDTVVTLTAHGIARPTRKVTLSSEVAGRILRVPNRLEAGDLVAEGDLLLEIDPVDYRAAVQEAEAAIARLDAGLQRLKATEKATRSQLKTSRRSRDLAQKDFDRLSRLVREGNSVSQAVAEAAERTLAQAEVQVLQLEQTLEVMPSQQSEIRSERAAATARLEQAASQLNRTTLRAPFDGRVVTAMVEEDSFVSPGTPLLELADDHELELQVPVQASELNRWIPFASRSGRTAWFPPLKPIRVEIQWTGSETGYTWSGTLDRVVSFDASTRTAMLAIVVSGEQLSADQNGFPLSDGMFCRVRIPGKTLENVFPLPREAVSFDNQAYISDNGRLRTVDVTVAWATEETAYVSEGIQEGDLVVGTRLVAPLEGVKLRDTDGD